MVKKVFTVKIGSESDESGLLRVAAFTMRDTETGKVSVGKWIGTKEEIIEFFNTLESNPEIKIKYE